MRAIKFRAFEDGKMIYENDILHIRNEDNLVLRLARFWSNIRNDSKIMQFTGLHDRNGKEIYEGDIIRVNTYVNVQYEVFEPDELVAQEIITEVSYNELFGVFELITIEEDLHLKSWGFYNEDENNDLEVIGNIHETPELLNQN